ncbi:MAG: peptidylprolyl isomerase [Gammaproteobacteria bacterium]|nr:peptidylprolyl isomerase [Gammaproteobacteria bacterium]
MSMIHSTRFTHTLAAALLGWVMCSDADATIVQVDTPVGSFQIKLLDTVAPITVDNFLNYLNDGDYENSFIHRSVVNFVVQGGGFTFNVDGQPDDNNLILSVPLDPPIPNEFGLANTRGTVAMAKIPGDPDSATSQWFVNVRDNHALDLDNGGFTVFGSVLGNGMDVVNAINDADINSGLLFPNLPIIGSDTDGDDFIGEENLIFTDFSVVNTEDLPFVINEGIDGAWENPFTDGQGIVFDVVDNENSNVVSAAWFTYDTELPPDDELDGFGSKQHRWFTLLGEFTPGSNTATLDIRLPSAGVFNDPKTVTRGDPVGAATVTFFDCFNGQFSFEFFGDDQPSGVFAIKRITAAPFCEMLTAPEPPPAE